MKKPSTGWPDPKSFLVARTPDLPVLFFCPDALHSAARRFLGGFPGLVTYAVKANDRPEVLSALVGAGLTAFDVASPQEIAAVHRVSPTAVMHYNNPVRSLDEIAFAAEFGVRSWSVDAMGELEKLSGQLGSGPRSGGAHELSVRFKLDVPGAAYDFGSKFGATPEAAVALLRRAADRGFSVSLNFHPGTQCDSPQAWRTYIRAAARIAGQAGLRIGRLNVGGGFAADRGAGASPEAIFAAIRSEVASRFSAPPALLCEPGRAMVSDAYALALRVKALRPGGEVFLNDGIYGFLAEAQHLGLTGRLRVLAPGGMERQGPVRPCVVFGPTCDSLDRLSEAVLLPEDLAEGDHVILEGMGAYGQVTRTRFNGYGRAIDVTVDRIPAPQKGAYAMGN